MAGNPDAHIYLYHDSGPRGNGWIIQGYTLRGNITIPNIYDILAHRDNYIDEIEGSELLELIKKRNKELIQ